jgi:hypothetical protein
LLAALCATPADAGAKTAAVPKVNSQKEEANSCGGCATPGSGNLPVTEERFESVPARPTRSSLTFRD